MKTMDIAWRLDYSYKDFVTDNIFVELDNALESINSLKDKFSILNTILNDCNGDQITIIQNHLKQIYNYLSDLEKKYENKKKEVLEKASTYQTKFDLEQERDNESFPGGAFYSRYLYYRNGVEIDPDTTIGGPYDNNSYTIYMSSVTTCVRDTHGNILRDITIKNHIFNGTSVTSPLKIRYKGTFPSHNSKKFVHYYKRNDSGWEDIDIHNLIKYL